MLAHSMEVVVPFKVSANAGRVGAISAMRDTAKAAWDLSQEYRAKGFFNVQVFDTRGNVLTEGELVGLIATGKQDL